MVVTYTFMQFSQNILSIQIEQTFQKRPPKRPFVQLIVDQSKSGNLNMELICLFLVIRNFTTTEVIGNGVHPPYTYMGHIMDPF